MQKKVIVLLLIIHLSFFLMAQQIAFPTLIHTAMVDSFDNYFGTIIQDPYRWLEDDKSEATKQWVIEENNATNQYLSEIPFRSKVKEEMTKMWNYENYSAPFQEGPFTFFYKNDGLQNQSVLYWQKAKNEKAEVFLDPNLFSSNGTSSLGAVAFSKHQKYCAYSVHEAGSDWEDIYILEMATQKKLDIVIKYAKNTGITWRGDDGFYYSAYDKPENEKMKYSIKNEFQKVFYHQIGTPQDKDKIIYQDKVNPLRYAGVSITEDEHYLFLYVSEGTDGSQISYMDLTNPKMKEFKVLLPGFKQNQYVVDNIGNQLIVVTNRDAPNNKVLLLDPAHPEMENHKELISEKAFKLESVSSVGGKLYCNYLVNACSKIQVHDFNGAFLHTVELPGLGSAGGFGGKSTDSTTYFSFSSFNMPPSIYEYHPSSNQSILYKATKLNYPLLPTVVEQLWFTSKDGTKVPMFVFHRSDVSIENNKPQPTLMYGYGGFNIPKTPEFSVQTMYFVQQGGVYVMVNLRGGSEFGELWHQGGMLEKKQNVFDDFIGAAECLIQKGITSKDKLAINGRSNGGLLVGACMTQRPDLFKVAIPTVGVLDMLRYHKFTIGWGWAVEYGRSDKQEDFNYLIKYSPLHNIHANTVYPATLITTGDHDDRVVPAHSFKFAATLQAANPSVNPILIRVDTQAGHGAGKPITKLINEWSDIISFTMYHLGMTIPK